MKDEKLSPGVINAPANAEEKIDGLIEEHGVKYEKERLIASQAHRRIENWRG